MSKGYILGSGGSGGFTGFKLTTYTGADNISSWGKCDPPPPSLIASENLIAIRLLTPQSASKINLNDVVVSYYPPVWKSVLPSDRVARNKQIWIQTRTFKASTTIPIELSEGIFADLTPIGVYVFDGKTSSNAGNWKGVEAWIFKGGHWKLIGTPIIDMGRTIHFLPEKTSTYLDGVTIEDKKDPSWPNKDYDRYIYETGGHTKFKIYDGNFRLLFNRPPLPDLHYRGEPQMPPDIPHIEDSYAGRARNLLVLDAHLNFQGSEGASMASKTSITVGFVEDQYSMLEAPKYPTSEQLPSEEVTGAFRDGRSTFTFRARPERNHLLPFIDIQTVSTKSPNRWLELEIYNLTLIPEKTFK